MEEGKNSREAVLGNRRAEERNPSRPRAGVPDFAGTGWTWGGTIARFIFSVVKEVA